MRPPLARRPDDCAGSSSQRPGPAVPRPPRLGIAGWLLFVALLAFLPMSAFSG